MNKAPQKKRVSKAQWLDRALEVLEAEGIQGVRVERLARDLAVAKAGFYWHFSDRPDLLQSMLDYWAHEYTAVLTENVQLQEGDPEERLYETMALIFDHNLAKYDPPIRSWAVHDPVAAKAVRHVNRMRLDFARSLFRALGFRGQQLEMRTRLFLVYQTWEDFTFHDLTKKERRALIRLRCKLLLSR
ncbi:MAG: TetR/AcrR family transcriptional regulator [Polyangiales bacterium]